MRLDLFLMFQASRKPAPLPKPAERIVNALTDSIQPLVDVPLNVIAFARKQLRQYHGVQELIIAFYEALSRGPPAAGDRRGRDQRREVDRGGRARRRRRRCGAGRALPAQRRGALSGDRRVGRPGIGAGRSPARRGAADPGDGAPPARPARGRARRCRVRARRPRRPRGGRPRGARRARGVPRRRGDEGQLARPPGRHHRGDAQRAGVVPQARREQAGARELAVGHRLGGRRAQRAPSTRPRRSRATPRSAGRTRRPSSRPRSWSRPRRRAGCRR